MNTAGVLATLEGSTEEDRLLLILRNSPQRGSWLELCQQTWAAGIGWYTQKSIELSPQQASALRSSLGTGPAAVKTVRAQCTADRPSHLRLWQAESA